MLGTPPDVASLRCEVRPRYRSNGALATVQISGAYSATVLFDEPQFALTPGQAAVFYLDDEVLGGGWIDVVSAEDFKTS
jgi:tRNA-specific 2-thiouridylase